MQPFAPTHGTKTTVSHGSGMTSCTGGGGGGLESSVAHFGPGAPFPAILSRKVATDRSLRGPHLMGLMVLRRGAYHPTKLRRGGHPWHARGASLPKPHPSFQTGQGGACTPAAIPATSPSGGPGAGVWVVGVEVQRIAVGGDMRGGDSLSPLVWVPGSNSHRRTQPKQAV